MAVALAPLLTGISLKRVAWRPRLRNSHRPSTVPPPRGGWARLGSTALRMSLSSSRRPSSMRSNRRGCLSTADKDALERINMSSITGHLGGPANPACPSLRGTV